MKNFTLNFIVIVFALFLFSSKIVLAEDESKESIKNKIYDLISKNNKLQLDIAILKAEVSEVKNENRVLKNQISDLQKINNELVNYKSKNTEKDKIKDCKKIQGEIKEIEYALLTYENRSEQLFYEIKELKAQQWDNRLNKSGRLYLDQLRAEDEYLHEKYKRGELALEELKKLYKQLNCDS